jgi:hypothetical protein
MKKYKLEFILDDNHVLAVGGENEGFTAFELLGLLNWKQKDLENQIFGEVKPDVVSRKVITEQDTTHHTPPPTA